jgi:hypothetical protein
MALGFEEKEKLLCFYDNRLSQTEKKGGRGLWDFPWGWGYVPISLD